MLQFNMTHNRHLHVAVIRGMRINTVADPGLRWGDQGAKCLVMALCLGPGGPKVLFGTYSHTGKLQK